METKCNQTGCQEPPAYRFTWPGRDEACICEKHAPIVQNVASAIGMHLQLIPLWMPGEESMRAAKRL